MRALGCAPTCKPVPTTATERRRTSTPFFPGPWTPRGWPPCALVRWLRAPSLKASTAHEPLLRPRVQPRRYPDHQAPDGTRPVAQARAAVAPAVPTVGLDPTQR